MEVWMIMMIINYKIYLMFCRSDWGLFLFSIAHLLDKRQTIYSLGSSQSYLSWPPFIIFIIFERIISLNRQFALVRFGGVWEGFSYKYIKVIPNISPLQSRAKIYKKNVYKNIHKNKYIKMILNLSPLQSKALLTFAFIQQRWALSI